MSIDINYQSSPHSLANKIGRLLWSIVWLLFFRPSPKPFHVWRRLLLRIFGARIGKGVCSHASAKIWAPWNLEMGDYSCLGHEVDCYCVDKIEIGAYSTVSQYSFLCTATHDYEDKTMPLVTAPISVGDNVWVCSDVFVGPGVKVGVGSVVGARSSVYKDVAPWSVVSGNPAKFMKARIINE